MESNHGLVLLKDGLDPDMNHESTTVFEVLGCFTWLRVDTACSWLLRQRVCFSGEIKCYKSWLELELVFVMHFWFIFISKISK